MDWLEPDFGLPQPIKEKREAWEGVGLGQIRHEKEMKKVKKGNEKYIKVTLGYILTKILAYDMF